MSEEDLLERAERRDKHLESLALEAERDGDQQGCWYAMAIRAENKRLIERIKARKATKE